MQIINKKNINRININKNIINKRIIQNNSINNKKLITYNQPVFTPRNQLTIYKPNIQRSVINHYKNPIPPSRPIVFQ